MKKSLKLIPAIVMLLISAILVSTSTFAWFSMNTTVRATGMQVTAKSSNTFLLIGTGDDDTAAEIQGAKQRTVALPVVSSSAYVFPSKPLEDGEIGSGASAIFSSGTAVTDAATAAAVGNWYTANSNDPGHSTANSSGSTVINATKLTTFDNYVIKKTVWLTLAVGSNDAHNLTVTLTRFANGLSVVGSSGTDNTAVKILVVTNDNNMVTLNGSDLNTPKSLHETTNTTLTDSTAVKVDIYIYYDGSETAVYTNNIANLLGAEIDLAFDVAVK